MSLIKWDPFRPNGWRNEIDRAIDDFVRGAITRGRGENWLNPSLDIKEDEKKLTVSIELPGISKEDVKVKIDGGLLTVSGKKESKSTEEGERWHVQERVYGAFERTVKLPDYIDTEATNAKFENGVLTVTIDKKDEVQPKQIDVSIG